VNARRRQPARKECSATFAMLQTRAALMSKLLRKFRSCSGAGFESHLMTEAFETFEVVAG
jgi:hypothetical protein